MYPVKVNANLKAPTTDELVGVKKRIHLDAFKYRIEEIERELFALAVTSRADQRLLMDKTAKDPRGGPYTVDCFLGKILDQCKEVFERHDSIPASDYIDDGLYRRLMLEMAELKVVLSCLPLIHFLVQC